MTLIEVLCRVSAIFGDSIDYQNVIEIQRSSPVHNEKSKTNIPPHYNGYWYAKVLNIPSLYTTLSYKTEIAFYSWQQVPFPSDSNGENLKFT